MLTLSGKTPETIYINNKEVEQIEINNDVVWKKTPPIPDYFYIENISNEVGEFNIQNISGNTTYSTDGVNWTAYDFRNRPNISVNAHSRLYLRGTSWSNTNAVTPKFHFTKSYNIGGNMFSLINYNTMETIVNAFTGTSDNFGYLFQDEINLNSAENINFGKVTAFIGKGIKYLFSGCTSLTRTSTFVVTEIGNNSMSRIFYGCSNLTNTPDLSNVTTVGNYGLEYSFSGCSNLTNTPDLSNVTTVGNYGMNCMFFGCTSLTTPPDLSNITTVGARGMYAMFQGCTSLTTPPDISSLTSISSDESLGRFLQGCTSLTTPPDLSNITTVGVESIKEMFYNCTSLNTPPDLSNITTVGDGGMYNMFYNCTSLTTGPNLTNITSIGTNGLRYLFRSCSNISTVYAPNIDPWDTNATAVWLESVKRKGTLYCPTGLTIPTGSSGIPSGWTRVDY